MRINEQLKKDIYKAVVKDKFSIEKIQRVFEICKHTIKDKEPELYETILINSKKNRKLKTRGWRAVNMSFLYFYKNYSIKELSKKYKLEEYKVSLTVNKYKNLVYKKPILKVKEREVILDSKKESYWKNEEEMFFNPCQMHELSNQEQEIYDNGRSNEANLPIQFA